MASSLPNYMLPTVASSSHTSARAATRAVVAPLSTKVSKQVSRPAKALPRPFSSVLPSAVTQTTFAARQKATPKPAVGAAAIPRRFVVTAAPRPTIPVVSAPRSSALTPADRLRLSKLVPAIEEEFGRLRESKLTESDWDDDLLCETDDESETTIFDKANMVVRSRDSSSIDPSLSSFTHSNTALAQILADFSDDVFNNNDATDADDGVFFNDDTVIHHSLAPSAYAHFVDPTDTDLELEEDVSMAALEELSYVEDDLVAALEQMDLADPVIGKNGGLGFEAQLLSAF
ncbi:unnamed protein product [Aureobasidium vineae]|uniref:Uncharacterized protein n=1 Tax=Aureobasidium vineae TaxID=2773715 RepID=A0A9N8JAU4_9PEZI|nr:unnamed protein product [Aureobasidium vineae]